MSAFFVAVFVSLAFAAIAGIVGIAMWLIVRDRTSEAVRVGALKLAISGLRIFASLIVLGFAALRFASPGNGENLRVPGVMPIGTHTESGGQPASRGELDGVLAARLRAASLPKRRGGLGRP